MNDELGSNDVLGPGVEISSLFNYPDFFLFRPLPLFLAFIVLGIVLRLTGFWGKFQNKEGEKEKGAAVVLLSLFFVASAVVVPFGAVLDRTTMIEDLEDHYGIEIVNSDDSGRKYLVTWSGNYVEYKGDRFGELTPLSPEQVDDGVAINDDSFPRPKYLGFIQIIGNRAWLITNATEDGEWAEVEVVPEEHRIEYGGGYSPEEE